MENKTNTSTSTTKTSNRCTSMWGNGTIAYVTKDGWTAVRLDGEKRIDEYPSEQIKAL